MKQVFRVVREPVIRSVTGENYTLGRVYLDNVFFCHSLEDEDRFLEGGVTEKFNGRTAIPRGSYRLTTSHSSRFGRVLPELIDVPGFDGVRIHGGNRAEDSTGCILMGKVRSRDGIAQCADTVSRVIDQIDDAADLGILSYLVIE